ncbi:MAG TPA: hypothetical protein ENJ26_01965 [Rhodobacteraceae bacterium]|nr:hypothetical protein [Paracoccaceae bacterium]
MILAVVAATPAVIPDIDIPGFSVKSIDLTDGKLTMEQPRLSGFTDKDRSYEVSARQAQQDVRNPKVISLDDIDAKVQFGATQWADLDATFGILDSDAETLVLERGITVRVNNGFEAFLKAAEIDLRAGRVESDQPVLVRKGNSTVRAQAMEIRDKGKTLLFRNGVTMTLVPDLEGGDAE